MTIEDRRMVVERYVAAPTLQHRNDLIAAHWYLCRRGARKFYRGTVDRTDLEQTAAVGLIKASQRYSQRFDTPFEAYAWLMIVGELMHFVRDHERLIRIPRTLRALDGRYSAAYEDLSTRLGREPTPCELANELEIPLSLGDEVRALRARPVTERRERSGISREQIETQPEIRSEAYEIEDYLGLGAALRRLSDRELCIVRGIFFREQTQAQVGRELGLSQRQISRLLQRTLRGLAATMAS